MRCRCLSSLDELSDHEDRWEQLRNRCRGAIFTSYPMVMRWLRSFGHIAAPRIVLAEEGGDLVGVAPLALRSQAIMGMPVRTLSFAGDIDRKLGFSMFSILADPGTQTVARCLEESLRAMDWNVLRARFMEDTLVTRQFMESIHLDLEGQQVSPSISLSVPIPQSGDVISRFGRSYRKNIHQRIRRMDRDADVVFRPIAHDRIEAAVDTYARQHIERWSARGGSLFQDPDNISFLKSISKSALSQGSGYAYELLINDEVAAQRFGFMEKSMAWGYMVGMNNAFADYSPGLVLLSHVMEDLRARGVHTLNLGEGGQAHKYHMGVLEARLLGVQAGRGLVSTLSKAVNSPLAKRLDSTLGIKSRLLRDERVI